MGTVRVGTVRVGTVRVGTIRVGTVRVGTVNNSKVSQFVKMKEKTRSYFYICSFFMLVE